MVVEIDYVNKTLILKGQATVVELLEFLQRDLQLYKEFTIKQEVTVIDRTRPYVPSTTPWIDPLYPTYCNTYTQTIF